MDHVKLITTVIGISLVFIGSIVMMGWIFDIGILKSLSPTWVTMKFTTALSFTLSGILFLVITNFLDKKSEFLRSLIILPAIPIIFFMGFAIAENLLDFESPVAKLFVSEDTGIHSLKKGLPSLGTMINFLLIGTSGLFFAVNLKPISKLLRITGLIIIIISVMGIIGYLISQPVMYYEIESISGAMAFHTAILFTLSGVVILSYSFVKSYVPFQTLTKHEYVWLASITITPGISVFLLKILESLSTTYQDFFGEMMYLASILVIISVIMIFQRIIHTHNNLDSTIQKRTKVIEKQYEELQQANEIKIDLLKKQAKQEKLSIIGKFSARLTHDLRNPLTVIYNEIAILRGLAQNKDSTFEPSFKRLERSADRMKHQIDDVLDFVKSKPPSLKSVSLKTILESSIETLTIPKEIKLTMPKLDVVISVDSNQIETVFTNLITNSIQSLNESGEITINFTENLDNVEVQIIDSGLGISEEVLNEVFEPLFTTKQKGTGLGLTSCKNIVEQHNGTISVKNNPTTFTILLPKI